jgi:hypothetical protein
MWLGLKLIQVDSHIFTLRIQPVAEASMCFMEEVYRAQVSVRGGLA